MSCAIATQPKPILTKDQRSGRGTRLVRGRVSTISWWCRSMPTSPGLRGCRWSGSGAHETAGAVPARTLVILN